MFDKKNLFKRFENKWAYIEIGDAFIIIALIEIRETFDRYIEQRIKSDKVFEGILKDIYNAVQESGSQN